MVATSVPKKEGRDVIKWSRHQLPGKEVATTFSGRDIKCKRNKVATSFSGREISCKERRSGHHLAVATSNPRDAKDKSRPNKSLCDVAETIEVATKNRGRDINKKMGQLN